MDAAIGIPLFLAFIAVILAAGLLRDFLSGETMWKEVLVASAILWLLVLILFPIWEKAMGRRGFWPM